MNEIEPEKITDESDNDPGEAFWPLSHLPRSGDSGLAGACPDWLGCLVPEHRPGNAKAIKRERTTHEDTRGWWTVEPDEVAELVETHGRLVVGGEGELMVEFQDEEKAKNLSIALSDRFGE